MKDKKAFHNRILEAIKQHELLAVELMNKVITETNQKEVSKIVNGEYYLMEQTENDNLSDNWKYHVHGEHCDFVNIKDGRTLTVCLGLFDSINYIDPVFFYSYLKNNPQFTNLAKELKPGFKNVYNTFKIMSELKLMKKVLEGFGPAFVRLK